METALAYSSELNNADYEIIDGVTYMLARPTTDHMIVEGNIFTAFKNYLKGKRCRPFNEVDVFFSEKDNFIPDVIIVCDPEIIKKRGIYGTPDLIVEIALPRTAKLI